MTELKRGGRRNAELDDKKKRKIALMGENRWLGEKGRQIAWATNQGRVKVRQPEQGWSHRVAAHPNSKDHHSGLLGITDMKRRVSPEDCPGLGNVETGFWACAKSSRTRR